VDVAIFGAGIAGLMSAIALRAQGHCCQVYERSRRSHEAGMGFILSAEGILRLESFGVELTGAHSGVPLKSYCSRNAAGDLLREQAMPRGSRSFRRRDLIAALVRALPPGAISFEVALDGLDFDAAGYVTAAHLASGGLRSQLRPDLYVAADGIGSRARQVLFPDWPAKLAQVPEVVGLVRCPETIRWAGRNFNKFHAPGGGIAVGVLPVDDERLVWFLQFDAHRFPPPPEDPDARRAFVSALVGDWAHPVPHLLALTDFAATHVWLPLDTDLLPRFHQGNMVLVGDAAHPMLPLTSQGVSSAIADVVALAGLIGRQDLAPEALAGALASYSAERRQGCAPYIAKGRELTRHFLAPQHAENVVLPLA
jgi:2-polyprenyl-6-methoxyphenol hydroxylase-like FAD-dependent oxidoreductase